MEIKEFDIKKEASYRRIHSIWYIGLSIDNLDAIVNLARIYNVKKIFEFGTWTGLSAVELTRHTQAIVYTIDHKIYLHPLGIEGVKEENLIKIIADSMKFDFTPYKEYFDMVFIDGGHSYNVVKSDTENGFMILKKGGIIAWHDYVPEVNILEYDVAKYIDSEIKPKYQLYRTKEGIIFLKKE